MSEDSKTYSEKERNEAYDIQSQAYKAMTIADEDTMMMMPHLFQLLIKRKETMKWARSSTLKQDQMKDVVLAKKMIDDDIKRILNI